MTKREACLFCLNQLDGSDEHIVPQSINGRLHSKEIICSSCNEKFGLKVDTSLSKTFYQFIHLLGLKNAKTLYVEDPEGRIYTKNKNNKIKPIKPELKIQRKNGLVYITITGDEENALKLLEKQNKTFLSQGAKPIKTEIKKDNLSNPPIKMEIKLDIDNKFNLVLNKIALEFYAYNGLDTLLIEELVGKVGRLDLSLMNVLFCNFNQEVRVFDDREISHLVALRTDENERILYCYIELFSLICAVVILKNEYNGPSIDFQYRQEVISGIRLDDKVDFVIDFKKAKPTIVRGDLSVLIDLFFERHSDKIFMEKFDEGLLKIREKLESEALNDNEFADKFIKQSADYIANLTIYEFPYAVSGFGKEQDEMVDYIHSSMQESMFEGFCFQNRKIIGLGISFTSDQFAPENCIIESFLKVPIGKRNTDNMVKVYCVLKNIENGVLIYIPFRNLFEELERKAVDK